MSRWAELAAVVCSVAAKEDEGVWVRSGAGEGADVANAVAGAVEEVERAVVEVVEGGVVANLQGLWAIEGNFTHVAASLEGDNIS